MFRKILIANRGEIAIRIIRTLREMGITSVAVFSDSDRDAPFVQEADEAYRLGPPSPGQSYLNIDAILDCCRSARVQAVHPGYGFLAENAGFARSVNGAGMTFIGPSPDAIALMGDKVAARQAAELLGVPLVPDSPGPVADVTEARAFANGVGYPVVVKAAGGGGGRGIRVVRRSEDMEVALDAASREAQTYFKSPHVYVEKYFENPRHVEIQILGDSAGTVVHLGERDCSIQRRHQKLIEESPSPAVGSALRERMGNAALRVAEAAHYKSAGTVEFLLTDEGEFYFLEMNTRIQVEHPVTEMVTGVDLIHEMILVAADEPISLHRGVSQPSGHAIEVRVNAEDPANGFRPTPALISRYREAGGIGVRTDSGVQAGFTIPQDYDSLLMKVIVWAPDRERARRRILRAMNEVSVEGPMTTIPFAVLVMQHPEFISGSVTTTFLERHTDELIDKLPSQAMSTSGFSTPFRASERVFEVQVNRRLFTVKVGEVKPDVSSPQRPRIPRAKGSSPGGNVLLSPMHGSVVDVKKKTGESLEVGDTIVVIEAMKMENDIRAHRSGTLLELHVQVGDTVETGQTLVTIG
ncbi:MAG: acetyl-CoA carboxylase biotin carboxylase subunit [Chloroflexota bacterium]